MTTNHAVCRKGFCSQLAIYFHEVLCQADGHISFTHCFEVALFVNSFEGQRLPCPECDPSNVQFFWTLFAVPCVKASFRFDGDGAQGALFRMLSLRFLVSDGKVSS